MTADRSTRRAGVRAGAALLALAVLYALPASAPAATLTEAAGTTTAKGTHSAEAKCPTGTHVVSGGGLVHVTPATQAQLPLNDTGRSGNGWSATGFTHDNNFPFAVTAYAYCGKNDLHPTTFTGDPVVGVPNATADVKCKTGNVVSGGGAMTGSYGYTSEYAKLTGDPANRNGWRTAADSRLDGGSSGTVPTASEASANCTPERYVLVAAHQGANMLASRIADMTAKCPAGTEVVSGGGEVGGTNTSDYAYIYASRMLVTDALGNKVNGWSISVESGPLSATTVTAYAYCVRLPTTAITKTQVTQKKRRATFTFGGTTGEGTQRFRCALDGKAPKACSSPATFKKLKAGEHTFTVVAVDPAGRVDPTPARKSFKIKKQNKQ